jgi:hypothetical protein
VANRSQLDLVITSLVLIRKASTAIDAALGLPAADRAQLDDAIDSVRRDLGRVVTQVGSSIPGAETLSRRPEVRTAAGVLEFVARQGASQLGAVAGIADTLKAGGDSRSLAQRIEKHLAEVGVASREDLALALGIEPGSERLQEALERALGTGRAEWYGPNVYGVPRGQLEELADQEAEPEPVIDEPSTGPTLGSAVEQLEGSLATLAGRLGEARPESEVADQIRELRRLADEGVLSEDDFERKKAEILEQL